MDTSIQATIQSLPIFQQQWINKAKEYINKKIDSKQLSVYSMAIELGVSERQLYRNIENALGMTPNQFIQHIRMEKARALLERGEYATIAEVSYAVGYARPDYFSKVFVRNYGKKPKDLIKGFQLAKQQ